MATSGSFDFDRTRNDIVSRALRLIGVIAQGDSITAAQLVEGSEALNAMVKNLQVEGLGLWAREWTTKTLSASGEVTGTDSNVYTCVRSHTSGATDRPITGANYTTYWRKTGDTGGTWLTATSYSAIGDFAPESDTIWIEGAFIRRSDVDTPLAIMRYADYLANVATKYTTGLTSELAFNYSISGPRVYLIPQPNLATDVVHYLRYRKLEDLDAPSNNPDSPVIWIEVLTFGLAHRLSHEYGIPLTERVMLKAEAEGFLSKALRQDAEIVSTEFIASAF